MSKTNGKFNLQSSQHYLSVEELNQHFLIYFGKNSYNPCLKSEWLLQFNKRHLIKFFIWHNMYLSTNGKDLIVKLIFYFHARFIYRDHIKNCYLYFKNLKEYIVVFFIWICQWKSLFIWPILKFLLFGTFSFLFLHELFSILQF